MQIAPAVVVVAPHANSLDSETGRLYVGYFKLIVPLMRTVAISIAPEKAQEQSEMAVNDFTGSSLSHGNTECVLPAN